MDDRSWMYWVSLEGLCQIHYCNGFEVFFNYLLSNLRNISGGDIRCPCKRCKNKKIINLDVVMMHLLQKKVHGEILILVCTWEPYVPYETMIKKNMVGLTSSSSNMHGVVDDNSNSYINIIMNVMRMNQSYVGECPNHRWRTKCK